MSTAIIVVNNSEQNILSKMGLLQETNDKYLMISTKSNYTYVFVQYCMPNPVHCT